MTKTNDLDILDPAPVEVLYRGERLEIRPLTVGQIPKVVRLARPIIDELLAADLDGTGGDGGDIVDLVLRMVSDHGEAAMQAAAVLTGRPVDWIEGGNAAEFALLARAVYEVNRDFFGQALAPLLSGWTGAAYRSGSGDGPTSSNPSSSAATA
jgi:hypothetical protein